MMVKHKAYILLLVWFCVCSGLIIWSGMTNKNEFDPQLQLSSAIMDLSFESELALALAKSAKPPLAALKAQESLGVLFHISQGACYCEWLAKPHQEKLNQWTMNNRFAAVNIDINDAPHLRQYIPSTPAVVVFDKHNKLIYLGPYSRGSGCFGANGEVDKQLNNYIEMPSNRQSAFNAVIDTDASGCYCAT